MSERPNPQGEFEKISHEIDITPENLRSNVPVLLAPGWGETSKLMKEAAVDISENGRRVVANNHPRGSRGKETSLHIEGDSKSYPQEGFQRALDLLELIDKKDLGKVDVVAHSQGGIDVAIAASLRPEKFRNIVLVDPGGMVGEKTFPDLLKKFAGKRNSWAQFKEGTKYIAKNPYRAIKEAVAVSRSEIHELLRGLKSEGIGISIIHGVDDHLFPMDEVQQIAKADQLDGFYSVAGGHDEIVRNPDIYAKATASALEALERKYP